MQSFAFPALGRTQANLLLLFAALLWGAGNVAQATVLDDIGPITAVGLRCALAALVILPFALRGRVRGRGPSRRLAAVTILAFAAAVTLLQTAYGHTTVTNASFLVNTAIVLTPAAAYALYRTRPQAILWPAAAAAFAGAWLMGGAEFSIPERGDGLCLLSACLFAVWMVTLGRYLELGGDAIRLTAAQFAVTAVLALAFAGMTETLTGKGLAGALPELIFLGLGSTGLGFLLQAVAQTRTSASEAAILVSAEAPFGALGGILILGERVTAAAMLGAVLIVTAIIIIAWPQRLTETEPLTGV